MKIYLASFTEKGATLEKSLAQVLTDEGHTVDAYAKYPCVGLKPIELDTFARVAFTDGDAIFFIGAIGIAVRVCAPYITNKSTDPAVISADELGRYIIPILSGHIGGANALAVRVAQKLGAEAIITTATDLNGKFAADTWAAENGCIVANPESIKHISAAVLKDEPVGFYSTYGVVGNLPNGITAPAEQDNGICVSEDTAYQPFTHTLHITPKIYCVGIGCRRGTAAAKIEKMIAESFATNALDIKLIKSIASIDLKSDEVGITELASKLRVPFITFSAEDLKRAEGEFSGSAFVASVTGVDNVCERAAVLASSGGELISRKTACCGVTVAIAKANFECRFSGENN